MENLWIRRAVIHPRVEKQASQRVYSMKADLIPAGDRAVFDSFCVSAIFFMPEKKRYPQYPQPVEEAAVEKKGGWHKG